MEDDPRLDARLRIEAAFPGAACRYESAYEVFQVVFPQPVRLHEAACKVVGFALWTEGRRGGGDLAFRLDFFETPEETASSGHWSLVSAVLARRLGDQSINAMAAAGRRLRERTVSG